jgi:hypothetical protein
MPCCTQVTTVKPRTVTCIKHHVLKRKDGVLGFELQLENITFWPQTMVRTVFSLASTICFLAKTVWSLARTMCRYDLWLGRYILCLYNTSSCHCANLIFWFHCLSLLLFTCLQPNYIKIYIFFCRTQDRRQVLYASEDRVMEP